MTQRVFAVEPWAISARTLDDADMALMESMTSTGNGHMGMRGNFEEGYSGSTHQGTYLAGVWYPDRTRVGWWKNGYPDYFGKSVNAMNIIAIPIRINGEQVDLRHANHEAFTLRLDLRNGVLTRSYDFITEQGRVHLEFERFLSLETPELCLQKVQISVVSGSAAIELSPQIDGDVYNVESNYNERFWDVVWRSGGRYPTLSMRTKPNPFGTPQFMATGGMAVRAQGLSLSGEIDDPLRVGCRLTADLGAGESACLEKTVAVVTSRDLAPDEHAGAVERLLGDAASRPYEAHKATHSVLWEERWSRAAVVIEGDDEAQQGIAFSLFQLFSTYYGEDERLNIGPKGFTGEKYGGATYWDTEIYLLPLYLAVADPLVSRSLLTYRHNQLPQAQTNAQRQGVPGALYPMVTFDGLECHNEWEITFEEIHRNGAIAYAIANYTRYTGDRSYLEGPGLEVLTEISRFWAGRVHYSKRARAFMIHGVTGPNEYENNINNNWYTNYLAAWVLGYTCEALDELPVRASELGISDTERELWRSISSTMYLPADPDLGVQVQHDTFLDKDLRTVGTLDPAERPLNKHWSWDKILRSCFIKQADVLQGIYLFEDGFSPDEIKRNFDFYEPMTVHESSLSASIHSVIASAIGERGKAVELYRRTARLDLDNYNDDTDDGLHITSMSGGWLAIVQGFAGMRVRDDRLSFRPFCPDGWTGYAFTIGFRDRLIAVQVSGEEVQLTLRSGNPLDVDLFGRTHRLDDRIVVPFAG